MAVPAIAPVEIPDACDDDDDDDCKEVEGVCGEELEEEDGGLLVLDAVFLAPAVVVPVLIDNADVVEVVVVESGEMPLTTMPCALSGHGSLFPSETTLPNVALPVAVPPVVGYNGSTVTDIEVMDTKPVKTIEVAVSGQSVAT